MTVEHPALGDMLAAGDVTVTHVEVLTKIAAPAGATLPGCGWEPHQQSQIEFPRGVGVRIPLALPIHSKGSKGWAMRGGTMQAAASSCLSVAGLAASRVRFPDQSLARASLRDLSSSM
jgi:hypothetical protein